MNRVVNTNQTAIANQCPKGTFKPRNDCVSWVTAAPHVGIGQRKCSTFAFWGWRVATYAPQAIPVVSGIGKSNVGSGVSAREE